MAGAHGIGALTVVETDRKVNEALQKQPALTSAKKQILLKRPTEVTELMPVDGETCYFEERGKPIRLTDLRAGDTVFITSKPTGGPSVAVTIHKGLMTLDLLRERYLKGAK